MSGHTNRNRRNGGNPRSRRGSQHQRGGDARAGQPKNNTPSSAEEKAASEPMADQENARPSQPPQPQQRHQPSPRDARQSAEPPDEPAANATRQERPDRPERQEGANPRGRLPFASAMRGGHAYIPADPANGARPGQNGQNAQNGHSGPNGRHGVNGQLPGERQIWVDDGGEDEGAGEVPSAWRIERLNGGTDTTPHDPVRPESRGEVGPLIDTLHELFAQDRAMASRGDSARCGICYLHFPLTALEHREDEGFYVCEGCKRLLGHHRLMMVRRQQAAGG